MIKQQPQPNLFCSYVKICCNDDNLANVNARPHEQGLYYLNIDRRYNNTNELQIADLIKRTVLD